MALTFIMVMNGFALNALLVIIHMNQKFKETMFL